MPVITPITFGSDVFVDPSAPRWLQAFVEVTPVSRQLTAERGLMSAMPVGSEVVTVLVWCALLVSASSRR